MVSYIGNDLVKYSPPNKQKVRIPKTEYLSHNAPNLENYLKKEKETIKNEPIYVSFNSESPESEEEMTGHIVKPATIDLPSSSITSLPNSPFNLKCICGL